jgi:two-component system phosphate regulon response regulator PhoB
MSRQASGHATPVLPMSSASVDEVSLHMSHPVVVLVEDDGGLREVVKTLLEQEGYRVVPCPTAFEALRAFFTEPRVDVLVLDWVLPDMEGRDLVRLLHCQHELAELPIVLTTGVDLALPGFEGAVCLLRKPFARTELLRLLHALTHHEVSSEVNSPPAAGSYQLA